MLVYTRKLNRIMGLQSAGVGEFPLSIVKYTEGGMEEKDCMSRTNHEPKIKAPCT